MTDARLSIILPACTEGEAIAAVLDRIFESVRLPCEALAVVHTEDDSTIPAAAECAKKKPRVLHLVNTYGRGPANAIRYGNAAAGPVAVVTMADGHNDARQIDDLTRLVERELVVAAASRYIADTI